MKVNRYINGIPLSENELQGMKITNDIVQQTFLKVRNERIYYQKKEEEKIHFAEFVSMTNAEYEKLVSTYGKDFADQCILQLDNYKGASG